MQELFLKLLDMSLTASIIALVVILLRLIFKKAPKWMTCVLWVIVGIRLICPLSFESELSIMPKMELSHETITFENISDNETIPPSLNDLYISENTEHPDVEVNVIEPDVKEAERSIDLAAIWSIGVAVMFIYMLLSYMKLYRLVKEAEPIGDGVHICDHISTSFILGILHPKIYIPSTMPQSEARYVISHEKAHIKRHDHWWKPVGFLFLSVYWFNPVLWLAYVLMCRDIELACDEKVIKEFDDEQKIAYATVLLRSSAPSKLISACPLAFGGNGVKNRINSVLNYKPASVWLIVLAGAVSVLASVCLLTDPVTALEESIIPPDSIDVGVLSPQDNSHLAINAKKYAYNGNDILILDVKNQSDENYSVTVIVKYYDENGKLLKKEHDTFEGFAADSSNYFLFQPGIKFDSYTCQAYTEKYEDYCLSKDISLSADSFMIFNDRIMNFYSTSFKFYINNSLQTDVKLNFSVVIFDTQGNVVDIISNYCESSQYEPGKFKNLGKRIDKDTFLTQAGSYIYTLADYVDYYEWNNIDNAICVISNISK